MFVFLQRQCRNVTAEVSEALYISFDKGTEAIRCLYRFTEDVHMVLAKCVCVELRPVSSFVGNFFTVTASTCGPNR